MAVDEPQSDQIVLDDSDIKYLFIRKLINHGFTSEEQVNNIIPVSYTHLDVYKRQTQPVLNHSHSVMNSVKNLHILQAVSYTQLVIPIVRRLLADSLTPVGFYERLAAGRSGTFMLESAEFGGTWSRYSRYGTACRIQFSRV